MLVRSRIRGSKIKLSKDCLGMLRGALRCVASLYATNTAVTAVQSVAVLHGWPAGSWKELNKNSKKPKPRKS
eukprot:6213640-Pleurochrysis_carterae.AAC.3